MLGAKNRGWMYPDGSLRNAEIRLFVKSRFEQIADIPTFQFISGANRENGGFIGLLTREYRGFHHPAKHIVLLAALFDDMSDFSAQYEQLVRWRQEGGEECLLDNISPTHSRLLEMVGSQGMSVNLASKTLGISVTQAIALLRKNGIPYRKRPRVLNAEKEKLLVQMLQDGKSRIEINRSFGFRKGYLKDYLARHPALREIWLSVAQAPLS